MSPERPSQELCPPQVRGTIARMEEFMRQSEYNHAGTPTQIAIELQRIGQIESFAHFETCLREMDSRVHFLAVPLDFYGDQYGVAYPLDRDGQPEYALYAAVNGADEAKQMLESLGITAAENKARLKNTGVLTLVQS